MTNKRRVIPDILPPHPVSAPVVQAAPPVLEGVHQSTEAALGLAPRADRGVAEGLGKSHTFLTNFISHSLGEVGVGPRQQE